MAANSHPADIGAIAIGKSWRTRARDQDLVFLCELGSPNYAITDANGDELSDRWQEALLLRCLAGKIRNEVAGGGARSAPDQSMPIGGASSP
jgi:hypothetical protein